METPKIFIKIHSAKTTAILYFVKFPEPGKVKTRLAKTLGDQEAARLYRLLAEKNFSVLNQACTDTEEIWVVFDPPDREQEIRQWLHPATHYYKQHGADLGERLSTAFDAAFKRNIQHVMALGSDTLNLCPKTLQKAFTLLQKNDAVLGPAMDGGYYLIGSSRPCPLLFKDIPWSTSEVLQHTRTILNQSNWTWSELEILEDMDEISNINLKEMSE